MKNCALMLTCADSGVVVCQQEALHPVLHVLQHPAVGQFVPGRLDGQPVQTLGRVVLDHLGKTFKQRRQTG